MRIGKLQIEQGIFLAPMEDVTDYPFRMVCKHLGADVVYSEFISSEALIREAAKAFRKMIIHPKEHPIGIQIYGNRIDAMIKAAQIAEEKGPDFIDINFGCPVKKVALKGAGAGLLRDVPLMTDICAAVVKHTNLPVTAKTRLGWDSDSIVILDVARRVRDVGVQALTLHARTRAQGFKGEANWTWIKQVKEAVDIPIIGNGDITQPWDVSRMFSQTGCDAVMIGRGAIHNPWIFRQAKSYRESGILPPDPSLTEKIELLKMHLAYSVEYKGENRGVVEMRKHYAGYLKGLPNIAKIRAELMTYITLDEVLKKLNEIPDMYEAGPHDTGFLNSTG